MTGKYTGKYTSMYIILVSYRISKLAPSEIDNWKLLKFLTLHVKWKTISPYDINETKLYNIFHLLCKNAD